MIKLFMRDHRNAVAHHFRRQEAWNVVTVFDYSVHRNVCNDAHRREVYRKTMHKHWPMAPIAVVPIVIAPTPRRQVINWNFLFFHCTELSN